MKPVIVIHDYNQNIYITLGEAIHELIKAHKEPQIETLLFKFNKCCESHGQCMDTISQFVNIVQEQEA